MKYIIIQAETAYGLQKEVNNCIADGANLAGGICVAQGSKPFYQALIY